MVILHKDTRKFMTSHCLIYNSKQYDRTRKRKETPCNLKQIIGCHTSNLHAG